jgi:TetR/AcrR family transcriptional regulator, transcriptional repressor for nem operon
MRQRTAGTSPLPSLTNYVAHKAPGMTCPMIAFAPDTARRGSDDPLHRTFSDGVRGLFDTFSEVAGGATSPDAEDRLRTLFAAMIGSNMLARSGSREEWSTAFGRSVLAASAAIRSDSEPPATR